MHKVLSSLTFAASMSLGHSAIVLSTNYDDDSGRQRPLSDVSGSPFLTGGVVAIGGWAIDPVPLINQMLSGASSARFQALFSGFIVFGAETSIGATSSGLYQTEVQEPIAQGDPLDGKMIFTFIGNGATIATSSEFSLITDGSIFNYDNPLFITRAEISSPIAQYVFGNYRGPIVETSLGPEYSVQLRPIPEPFSAALLLSGVTLLFRRRYS